ncbi:MAG: hydroxymethylbilane synthase [Pirellulales bacterium]|nr:hydroxymethylbilane synthase [Pirellulales bacterium]
MADRSLRLGTRGSALARWQAEWVADRLRACGASVELVEISTRADQQPSAPVGSLGSQGVFTKELQRALQQGLVDLVVHSLKDLPTEKVEGLVLAAVPPRGPVADVLVAPGAPSLAGLAPQARVGTGSLRRRVQLWHARPDLQMCDIRGNVDTRLRKLLAGQYDALVLAQAGLERLALATDMVYPLPCDAVLPAVGQGALGIEARLDDQHTLELLKRLDDAPSHAAVRAERALLARLRGGCLAPVAAWCRPRTSNGLHLSAVVLSADGRTRLFTDRQGNLAAPEELGVAAADDLLAQGAAELIQAARGPAA